MASSDFFTLVAVNPMAFYVRFKQRLADWYFASLANQLASWSMVVSACAVLAIAGASLILVFGVIQNKELALFQKDVAVASGRLSAALNQLEDEFQRFSQNPTLVNGLADGDAAQVYLRRLIQSFRFTQLDGVAFQLFDYRARVVVQTPLDASAGEAPSQLIGLGTSETSAAQFVVHDRQWYLVMMHAIAFPDSNAAQGFLQAYIPIDRLLGSWLAPNRDPRSMALTFTDAGRSLTTHPLAADDAYVVSEPLTLKEPLERLNLQLQMREEGQAPIEALRTLLPIFIGLVAIALVAAGWINWALGQRLARPLVELAERARVIAQTKTFAKALPVVGVDETAQLTRNFNRMLIQLQQLQEELQRIAQIRGARLATIFELSPDGFVEMNAHGAIGYLNPAFTKLTGIELTQLPRADWAALAEQLDAQLLEGETSLRALGQAQSTPSTLSSPSTPSGPPTELPSAPRAERIVRLHTPSLKTLGVAKRESSEGGVILYWRDLTREAEMQAMKSAFLAKAAHELRTPLTSILGFTELLGKDQHASSKQQEIVSIMLRQGRNLLQLIHDLLDLARIEVQSTQWQTQTLHSLTALTQLIVREFAMPGDERQWIFALQEHLSEVRIDANAYRQVLTNILSNALKYSPPGSPIRIASRTRNRDGRAWQGIAIEDQGMGMSAQELAHLGERFYRANPQGAVAGTGLGLSVVEEIMRLHGGEVCYESQPGVGTTVTIWFSESQSA